MLTNEIVEEREDNNKYVFPQGEHRLNQDDYEYISKKYGGHEHYDELNAYITDFVLLAISTVYKNIQEFENRLDKYKYMEKIQNELNELVKESDELHMNLHAKLTRMKFMISEINQTKANIAIEEIDTIRQEMRDKTQNIHQLINEKYNKIYKECMPK